MVWPPFPWRTPNALAMKTSRAPPVMEASRLGAAWRQVNCARLDPSAAFLVRQERNPTSGENPSEVDGLAWGKRCRIGYAKP